MFWQCLSDWHMWPIYLLGLTWLLPSIPMSGYLTLSLKNAGFGTFETNLLSIPAYVLFILNLLFFTWLSEKLNERFLLATVSQWWVLPCLIALEVLAPDRNRWVQWALVTLVYAMPYFHAMIVAITSRNAGSVRTRTVASAIYNMTVQLSNIIGSNVSSCKRGAISQCTDQIRYIELRINHCIIPATRFFLLWSPGTLCYSCSQRSST